MALRHSNQSQENSQSIKRIVDELRSIAKQSFGVNVLMPNCTPTQLFDGTVAEPSDDIEFFPVDTGKLLYFIADMLET